MNRRKLFSFFAAAPLGAAAALTLKPLAGEGNAAGIFRVGQRVVCMNDAPSWGEPHPACKKEPSRLRRDEKYIVRRAERFWHPSRGPIDAVWLEGIERVIAGVDFPYNAGRFRPAPRMWS